MGKLFESPPMNCALRGSYEPDCDLLMFRTAQTSLTRSKRVSGSEALGEASRSWLGFTVQSGLFLP
jgi:hypothetical protein